MLANVKIVLVETTHPGNIGAVARAMKNMGLSHLCLVAPKTFPCADATSRASGADDILGAAQVCETLDEAIADCQLVIGTSARLRTISWPLLTPRQCAEQLAVRGAGRKAAILFGREHSGLKNTELDRCQYLLTIPCNEHFSSLNIAAAVQVVAYEFFLASRGGSGLSPDDPCSDSPPATAAQMESFYGHLHQALADIGFLHPDKSRSIMRRLRRVFNRAGLDCKELDILRGILSAAQGKKSMHKTINPDR